MGLESKALRVVAQALGGDAHRATFSFGTMFLEASPAEAQHVVDALRADYFKVRLSGPMLHRSGECEWAIDFI